MRLTRSIKNQSEYCVVLVGCLALSFWMNWGSLRARLGPIDDHELATLLGPDRSLKFWNIPYELFVNTEVGDLGSTSRFRWGFYLRRLIETSIFRDNAGIMYFIQTLIIACTAFLLFMVVRACQINFDQDRSSVGSMKYIVNASIPFAASVWFLSTPSLTAGFGRLGIQEPTLVLGILLAIFGSSQLIQDPSSTSKVPIFLIAGGAILASGSKENGYIVVVPLLIGFVTARRQIRSRPAMGFMFIASISICLVVYHNIRVLLRGSDQYGTTKSGGGLIASMVDRTNSQSFLIILLCTLLLSALHAKIQTTSSKANLLIVLFCIVLQFSESFFYGEDSVVTRYHAVSDISMILVVSISIQSVLLHISPSSFRSSLRGTLQFPAVGLLLVIYLYPIQVFSQNRSASYALAASTIGYQQQVSGLSTYLKNHPSNSLVIYLFDTAADGEPAYAMIQYLRMNGVANKFYLTVREVDDIPSAELLYYRQMSIAGNSRFTVEPWSKLNRSITDSCFSPTYNLTNPEIMEADEVRINCGYIG
jgi:hypothetical protein